MVSIIFVWRQFSVSKQKRRLPGHVQPAVRTHAGKKLVPTDDSVETRLYSMVERFETDEIVKHKSLGIGIVQQVQPGNKIEVLFESGKRLLVHGR